VEKSKYNEQVYVPLIHRHIRPTASQGFKTTSTSNSVST